MEKRVEENKWKEIKESGTEQKKKEREENETEDNRKIKGNIMEQTKMEWNKRQQIGI